MNSMQAHTPHKTRYKFHDDEIFNYYTMGFSITFISKKFNVTRTTVYNALKRHKDKKAFDDIKKRVYDEWLKEKAIMEKK
ncbi:hypothetical protein R5E07_003905 [Vibrio vulnificus]|nr:hypothetical protein [Vibrio vulnificus]ELS9097787.1 hypothetical protein [Vibrio vulnificus]